MKVNHKFLAIAAISLGLLWSCKKTDEGNISKDNPGSSATGGVTLENGYLKFSDQKSFDSISTVLISKQGVDLEAWEARFSGFKSYRAIFKNIQDEYEKVNSSESFQAFKNKYSDFVTIKADSSLTYKFGTPLSSLFTNAKGEVKIGDQLKVYPKAGENVSKTKKTEAVQANEFGSPTGQLCQQTTYNGDSKRRLHVELWYDEITDGGKNKGRFYFAVTQEGKKTFGGWGANETDLNFRNVSFGMGYVVIPTPPNVQRFNLAAFDAKDFKGTFILDMGRLPAGSGSIGGSGFFFSRGVPIVPKVELAKQFKQGIWENVMF